MPRLLSMALATTYATVKSCGSCYGYSHGHYLWHLRRCLPRSFTVASSYGLSCRVDRRNYPRSFVVANIFPTGQNPTDLRQPIAVAKALYPQFWSVAKSQLSYSVPRADVMKLSDLLRNKELAAGLSWSKLKFGRTFRCDSSIDVGYRREMRAQAHILALEEAIDTEWVCMWDTFGGYLLLLLGLTAKAERVQDEVCLRLFLDNIGFSGLSAKKIKKWMPEDRRQFELVQESYIREKEIEEEILMQRCEEEGKGKERRKALLEKEERKWKEIEASLISSIPNIGSRDADDMAVVVRAVGGCKGVNWFSLTNVKRMKEMGFGDWQDRVCFERTAYVSSSRLWGES